eukprot:6058260-Pyramimonas_sp.AAC.1
MTACRSVTQRVTQRVNGRATRRDPAPLRILFVEVPVTQPSVPRDSARDSACDSPLQILLVQVAVAVCVVGREVDAGLLQLHLAHDVVEEQQDAAAIRHNPLDTISSVVVVV